MIECRYLTACVDEKLWSACRGRRAPHSRGGAARRGAALHKARIGMGESFSAELYFSLLI